MWFCSIIKDEVCFSARLLKQLEQINFQDWTEQCVGMSFDFVKIPDEKKSSISLG